MKRHTLYLIPLILSLLIVQLLLSPAAAEKFRNPIPRKIAPSDSATPSHGPIHKKYSPAQLNRIYFFEHIHRSVEKGKRAAIS